MIRRGNWSGVWMGGFLAILFLLGAPLWTGAYDGVPGVEHVVIIGCDGMSPAGIFQAKTPVMDQLMRDGAHTMHARAVMPTSSSSNWASMIMGAGPEQHGVTSNDWQPDQYEIDPIVKGPGGIFPTIFGVIREQRPQAITAVFHDWDDFKRLLEQKMVDQIAHGEGPEPTMQLAVDYVLEKKPLFTFVHLDHVDHAGHEYGWGTPEYIAAVEKADLLIGRMVETLKMAGIYDQTLLLVTADHGGVGKKHGGDTMTEIEIPWILRGPGVLEGKEITDFVNTYDTAATVAYALGLKTPSCWIARPVVSAFQK